MCEESLLVGSDIPCYVLLPINTSMQSCDTITASYYYNTTFLYSQSMDQYTTFLCNSTFNQTVLGDYNIDFSNGDSGKITVREDAEMMFFNLTLYAFLMIGSIIFIILAHKSGAEDEYNAASIVYGVVGATLSFISMGMIFTGFEVIHGVVLLLDVNYYLGILSMAIGLYSILCTYNYYKDSKETYKIKMSESRGY